MTLNSKQLGEKGEEIAMHFLKKQNFSILETNWRYGHLEIDIIAEDESTLIFCEVKTRSSARMGAPEHFVTLQKQRHLIKAAHFYIQNHQKNKEARFDIISIVTAGNQHTINHIKEAFSPKW